MPFRSTRVLLSLAAFSLIAPLPVAPFFVAPLFAQTAPPAHEPAVQLPPDQAAFQKANNLTDSRHRIAALEVFLHDFPKSSRAGRARSIVLRLLVLQQPPDEHHIHQIAKAMVDSASKEGRRDQENSVAYILAEAPPNGVDLKSAEDWANDAVKRTRPEAIAASVTKSYREAKAPAPSASDLHQMYAVEQAANVQTLADVYFHEGKLSEATATIQQAQQLSPTQGANFVTLAQIEHARHQDDKAVNDLESAEVYGGMTVAAKELLAELYTAKHGGSSAGLDAEIDSRYHALFKADPPPAHTAPASGRTVLLALYTGAGCEPCIDADLALDDVIATYPRSQVVALAFDQHIPEPDPLANPAGIARGDYDAVRFTPTFRIDGVEGPQVGGRDRAKAEQAFQKLATVLDKQLAISTGVTLHLVAALNAAHEVVAKADVNVTDAKALQQVLATPPEKSSEDGSKKVAAAAPDAPYDPKLVLNFALVQREVRYSGENGIRFHSMVVRDLAKPTADAFPVQLTGEFSASYSFHPVAISADLAKYLADFAQHSERFGMVQFMSTDTTIPLDDLAVAAWVEDLTSHHVVAAAYMPVTSSETQQAKR